MTDHQYDRQYNHDECNGRRHYPHPDRHALILDVNIRIGIIRNRSFNGIDLHRKFLGLRLSIGILIRHRQFRLGFAGLVRSECESNGAGRAGRHIADVLLGLRGGDTVAFNARLDIGNVALALVHVIHGDSSFLTRVDDIGHHWIVQFKTIRLRNGYGNFDVGSVGAACGTVHILVFEADVDALRAVFRTGQCLHRHGLRQRSSRIQRIVVERVRTAGDGKILTAVHGDHHVAHRHFAHVLEGETEVEGAADSHRPVAIGEIGDNDVRHRPSNLLNTVVRSRTRSIGSIGAIFGERRRHNAYQRDGDHRQ